ncbi:MAG: TetR/AcrR family transcriptional regulator [Lachnospiraceae bacterium]|nr:TetR/AcrR family transcriptional regulator [Lachnospiraceae bacterium]
MYHMINDKRARISAGLIYDGLMKCLDQKPFEKITIQDIQNVSGVGRATFYRQFDSLVDVLDEACDRYFKEFYDGFHEAIKKGTFKWEELLPKFIHYWYEHSRLLEILFSIGRQDIVYRSNIKYAARVTQYVLPDLHPDSKEYRYLMHIRTAMMNGVLSAWLENGKQETDEEVIAMICGTGKQVILNALSILQGEQSDGREK